MKLKKIMILELTELETDAIKTLIGRTSEKARLDLGLTLAQSNTVSDIYDHLPNLDDGKDA
jgi:hypothetical protein